MVRQQPWQWLTGQDEQQVQAHVQMKRDEIDRRVDHEAAFGGDEQHPQWLIGLASEPVGHPEGLALAERFALQVPCGVRVKTQLQRDRRVVGEGGILVRAGGGAGVEIEQVRQTLAGKDAMCLNPRAMHRGRTQIL